jgi:hypothetical protein
MVSVRHEVLLKAPDGSEHVLEQGSSYYSLAARPNAYAHQWLAAGKLPNGTPVLGAEQHQQAYRLETPQGTYVVRLRSIYLGGAEPRL